MKKFKYVIANYIPILFFIGLEHKDVARGLHISSAGFCDVWLEDNEWKCKCYGGSISLGIKSNPNVDTEMLGMVLNSEHY